jgi:rhamnogalacturonyl hydrolase YesR
MDRSTTSAPECSAQCELYAKFTIRHNADLGAVLYGFLVRWEMTGDPAWRDRAIAIAHSYGDYMVANFKTSHSLLGN